MNDEQLPVLGYDPETSMNQQTLKEIKWWPILNMKNDRHVSKVIKALKLKSI